ncbi:hypothetical protein L249_8236 [Ophiocordyceps polyrhachis-furcata BCC 54312]|uniref:Uncharacterized protein n=1 Tax=Ophiocordyceps polyrhachis-furcata BCC 54312 TaxID=1330021 RepID=A0A367LHC8_9HYPO|nr:hypothetical protein L249_8236 [Ophiocordyceps polyrhachis-furcata BCC 54312]
MIGESWGATTLPRIAERRCLFSSRLGKTIVCTSGLGVMPS